MKNKQPLFSDKIIAIYDAWMCNKRVIQKYRVNMFIKKHKECRYSNSLNISFETSPMVETKYP